MTVGSEDKDKSKNSEVLRDSGKVEDGFEGCKDSEGSEMIAEDLEKVKDDSKISEDS